LFPYPESSSFSSFAEESSGTRAACLRLARWRWNFISSGGLLLHARRGFNGSLNISSYVLHTEFLINEAYFGFVNPTFIYSAISYISSVFPILTSAPAPTSTAFPTPPAPSSPPFNTNSPILSTVYLCLLFTVFFRLFLCFFLTLNLMGSLVTSTTRARSSNKSSSIQGEPLRVKSRDPRSEA